MENSFQTANSTRKVIYYRLALFTALLGLATPLLFIIGGYVWGLAAPLPVPDNSGFFGEGFGRKISLVAFGFWWWVVMIILSWSFIFIGRMWQEIWKTKPWGKALLLLNTFSPIFLFILSNLFSIEF